jgi:hypothetical protein
MMSLTLETHALLSLSDQDSDEALPCNSYNSYQGERKTDRQHKPKVSIPSIVEWNSADYELEGSRVCSQRSWPHHANSPPPPRMPIDLASIIVVERLPD